MEHKTIPEPIITVVGDILGNHYYHHQTLNRLFAEHGAPGEPPEGNCVTKCTEWFKRCNVAPDVDSFAILGGVLKDFIETRADIKQAERVHKILAKYGLSYHSGGQILGAVAGTPTRSLKKVLEARDLAAVELEVQRALVTVELDPAAGVTAACSLIEALCKAYIEDEHLELPTKANIKDLWKVASRNLGLAPGSRVDEDLNRILSGMLSVIDGIGALRTHVGSAHGHGREMYSLEPRHARLAIHAAHTLATFILETWKA